MYFNNTKKLSSNELKNIAILAMFFDHLFSVFVLHESVAGSLLRIIGRIVAPIMCYLIAEGFFHTKDIKKYIVRLFIFALISHFPYVMYYNLSWWKATSVIWGLLLGLIALTVVKNKKFSMAIKLAIVIACCLLAYTADWNYVSVLWIVFFGIFRGDFEKQMVSFSLIGVILYIFPTILRSGWAHSYAFGIFLAVPLIYMYSGKQGKKSRLIKWSFYVFYPAHLILLEAARHAFNV